MALRFNTPPPFSIYFFLFLVFRCPFSIKLAWLVPSAQFLRPPPTCVPQVFPPPHPSLASAAPLPLNNVATPAPPPACMTSWKTETFRDCRSKVRIFHIRVSVVIDSTPFERSSPVGGGESRDLQRKMQWIMSTPTRMAATTISAGEAQYSYESEPLRTAQIWTPTQHSTSRPNWPTRKMSVELK